MKASRALAVALAVALALQGCGRKEARPREDGAPALPSVRVELPGAVGLGDAIRTADLRVEARRGVVASREEVPSGLLAALESHYGAPLPLPLSVQVAAVTGGRTAALIQATRGDARPLVLLLEPSGRVAWVKTNPMGGVKPGATEAALASGPAGHVALAWCNPSSGSVALRQWAEDGGAFADYEAARFDSCEALSALYWPRKGWLLAIASLAGLVLQRVTEDGALAWGRSGIMLPWTARAAAPASLALDTEETFLLFRLGQSGGPSSPDFVFVSRYGPDGQQIWPATLSVKRLDAPPALPSPRLVLEAAPEGGVRATLPARATGTGQPAVVEVGSDGVVVRR